MDLFNDEQFEKYRIVELEAGIDVIKSSIIDMNGDYLKGAMDMLRSIINVPPKMVADKNSSSMKQAEMLKSKAFVMLEAKLLRVFVEPND